MTAYLIKIILCSVVFLIAYKLLLEKERMHLFKRFYLLSGLILSFVIPIIHFSSPSPGVVILDNAIFDKNILKLSGLIESSAYEQKRNYFLPIVLFIYVTITVLLSLRFLVNLKGIFSTIMSHQALPYKKSKMILIDEDLPPHSFLNYIFINKKGYNNGNVSSEILTHEYAHIQQKHSYDLLFIELLQIFVWFNPLLGFYRKAIQLNHEFLADESVIETSQNIKSYQYLLIGEAKRGSSKLTSQFNYSITKMRLVMMTKTKSSISVVWRQMAIIPVLVFAVFIFSSKALAQVPTVIQKSKMATPSTQEGVNSELLKEYQQIVNKTMNENGNPDFRKFSDADKKRLETIFLMMSKEQQAEQRVVFMPIPGPSPKIVPTETQLESWKDSRTYGVWIDNKRIKNSDLDKYRNTDFSDAFVSRILKNATNYGKHDYQVDLMTNAAYETYYKNRLESKEKYQMAIVYPKQVK